MQRTALALTTLALLLPACTRTLDQARIGTAEPDARYQGDFNNLYRDGRFYFSGQPTETGLESLEREGVTTVINLRTDAELEERVPFNEPAVIDGLGMRYIHIPVSGASFSSADVDAFARALEQADGKVLIHCGSSNRAGAMWAAYLNRHRGFAQDVAIERGKAAGITSDGALQMAKRVMDESR